MTSLNLMEMTDTELNDTRLAVLDEQERRQRLADIPSQIKQLATTYEQSGGDRAALANELAPEPVPTSDLPADNDSAIVDGAINDNQETNENGTTEGPTST